MEQWLHVVYAIMHQLFDISSIVASQFNDRRRGLLNKVII